MENTELEKVTDDIAQDHLHIRGEHQSYFPEDRIVLGSSPHTWRTPAICVIARASGGIISTYVENTSKTFAGYTSLEDHLHIRGEHLQVY